MAEAGYWLRGRTLNLNLNQSSKAEEAKKSFKLPCVWATKTRTSNEEFSLISRKNQRSPRRLVKIATSSSDKGRWNGKWTSEYIFSLQQLHLQDLVEDDEDGDGNGNGRNTQVSITLSIEKFAVSDARLLKWPALFIERVQMERLCRETRQKVPKARSVEIQKEDPENVDRLCARLGREIEQMRLRLARRMKLSILKWDAKKNGTTPDAEAIKAIKEDPALLSDPELSDCSDTEIADLSED